MASTVSAILNAVKVLPVPQAMMSLPAVGLRESFDHGFEGCVLMRTQLFLCSEDRVFRAWSVELAPVDGAVGQVVKASGG